MRPLASSPIRPSTAPACFARRRRKLKNNALCAAVVPVRTIDQLRSTKSCIVERIHHAA